MNIRAGGRLTPGRGKGGAGHQLATTIRGLHLLSDNNSLTANIDTVSTKLYRSFGR
jgi:hypothetical protein